jgi:uncharacterized protein (DUF427 family)
MAYSPVVALTLGTGPFGDQSTGSFTYVEDSPRWIRARLGGETVADSRRTKLLHRFGRLPVHLFPPEDVRSDLLPEGAIHEHDGLVEIDFGAVDEWLEEDEELLGHARDPYHRIDTRRTSRPVRIERDGELLAESTNAVMLWETNLPTRFYLPREDVVAPARPGDKRTTCAYKGHASYLSFDAGENLAWIYEAPLPEAAAVRGRVAFFDELVDVTFDGERRERPRTVFAKALADEFGLDRGAG